MKSSFIALSLVLALCSFACGDDDESDMGAAGSGGSGTGGSGGSGGGSACPADGSGEVTVEITGLPGDVDADVLIEGPRTDDTATATTTLSMLDAGSYSVTAARVFDADPIVRTVYEPSVDEPEFCLAEGGGQTVTVTYEAIATSNKLWSDNANAPATGGPVLGYASADLAASGDPAASVVLRAGVGKDVTFDRDGNLWTLGGTVADAHLQRFAAADLGASGEKEAEIEINVMGIPCSPELQAMAFDADGNLWLRTCGVQIAKIDAVDLDASGDATPTIVLSGLTGAGDIAFDAEGNLWATNDSAIVRFDASRLTESSEEAPDLSITARDAADTMDLAASALAFDADRDLWASDFGGNLVFELSAADLEGTADQVVVSNVSIAIGVASLIDRPAFDDGGGLWLALGAPGIGRLSPAQLEVSSSAGDPTTPETIITSADLGSPARVAFFPAAVGLPLYHSLPAPGIVAP